MRIASIASSLPPHNYSVINASVGTTPKIIVTPGNHYDSTGGQTWIPTINGNPINIQIGSPAAYPSLIVGSSDNVVYFKITTNPQDGSGASPAGAITAIEIDSGTSLPNNDNATFYQPVAYITVTITSVAVVTSNEGGVSNSQDYQFCGGSALYGVT